MKKRILAVLMTAAMVLGITACGDNATQQSENSETEGNAEEIWTEIVNISFHEFGLEMITTYTYRGSASVR